jgi:hypothetical protein
MNKYYYGVEDLFYLRWVECTVKEYEDASARGLPLKVDTCNLGAEAQSDEDWKDVLEEYADNSEDCVDARTPLKDALLEELREHAPAIVSILADELIDEEDLQITPEEVQYYVDEELINPDYDKLEFEDAEEATSDKTLGSAVADSSTNTNKWFPNAAITTTVDGKASSDDVKKVTQAIYTLMEGGMQYDSDELDGGKFVKRLETSRDVTTQVNKKTRANPSILFLPDFSPSCSSYAQLYNTLLGGVTTIRDDFNVISAPHYNGLPKWFVINGKKSNKEMVMFEGEYIKEDSDGNLCSNTRADDNSKSQDFYFKQIAKVVTDNNITTVVIAGDMDGVWLFKRLLLCGHVERVIWVDGSYWESEGKITDKTAELCYRLFTKNAERQIAKSKLSYWCGVKTVKEFVRVFERCNSW